MSVLTVTCLIIGVGYGLRDIHKRSEHAAVNGYPGPGLLLYLAAAIMCGVIGLIVGEALTEFAGQPFLP